MNKILPISAFKDNYIWAIVNPNGLAVVVDPGEDKPVKRFLKNHKLHLAAILITHHHSDHVGGVEALKKAFPDFPLPVYGPLNSEFEGITEPVEDGSTINLSNMELQLKVIDIPGHTLDHIAYYDGTNLFCGDTLFGGGCGRMFEGTAQQLHQSLSKLAKLPPDTKVYCGHEYTQDNLRFAHAVEEKNPALIDRIRKTDAIRKQKKPTLPSTIALELATNPFLRCEQSEVRQSAKKHAEKELKTPVDVFAALRKWKDNF